MHIFINYNRNMFVHKGPWIINIIAAICNYSESLASCFWHSCEQFSEVCFHHTANCNLRLVFLLQTFPCHLL